MQKLEAVLGSKLLTRTARGINLTTAGETLLPVARRLDSLLGDLGQVFPKSGSRSPALIRIGSLETFAATHLAGLIASYHPIDPQPEFAITNGSSRSLVHMLQDGELDIAFVSHPASVESLRTARASLLTNHLSPLPALSPLTAFPAFTQLPGSNHRVRQCPDFLH
jgi:LysR family transcriptional regulator, cell division regulator